eukprot:3649294-Prymnesium_polylepis.1
MNASGNNITATFDAVPYTNVKECWKRVAANAILNKHRIKWRFRVKKSKTGKPKRAPLGNCARRLHTNPDVLCEIAKIMYEEEVTAADKERLEDAAEAADDSLGSLMMWN